MFHMGWFLHYGFGVYGWNQQWSGNVAADVAQPGLFVDMATSLERAGFDYMMIEDSSVVPDIYQGSLEFSLRNAVVRHDPMALVPLLAQATEHIGIIATCATTFYPPFLAARLFTTLDHLTNGRVGINLVTASPHAAAQNYGYEKHFEHDLRYEMADEWMTLVSQLWESWEPGSLILDEATDTFADASKVHRIDFEGRFYKSRGPLNTVPGPQRRPVVCQAGGSPAGREVAARHADTIVALVSGIEAMKEYKEDITERLIRNGRKPDDAKLLFLVSPILGDTDAEAQAKHARSVQAQIANLAPALAGQSYLSGIDFSKFDLDEPLPDLTGKSNGHQSMVADLQKAAGAKTLRETLVEKASGIGSLQLVGSPDSVAVQMGEVMDYVGGDGFLIASEVTRKNITEIADGLAPALRRRGLMRGTYPHQNFRDNLLSY
jgi:FMN-dependent oxidoreductase (nitrilotriacetate monooxygenase family)